MVTSSGDVIPTYEPIVVIHGTNGSCASYERSHTISGGEKGFLRMQTTFGDYTTFGHYYRENAHLPKHIHNEGDSLTTRSQGQTVWDALSPAYISAVHYGSSASGDGDSHMNGSPWPSNGHGAVPSSATCA